jgi:hypothetical protein
LGDSSSLPPQASAACASTSAKVHFYAFMAVSRLPGTGRGGSLRAGVYPRERG